MKDLHLQVLIEAVLRPEPRMTATSPHRPNRNAAAPKIGSANVDTPAVTGTMRNTSLDPTPTGTGPVTAAMAPASTPALTLVTTKPKHILITNSTISATISSCC